MFVSISDHFFFFFYSTQILSQPPQLHNFLIFVDIFLLSQKPFVP